MSSVSSCDVDGALGIMGDRWTLAIIHELSVGPRRTLELLASFTGLSTKTLAVRLKRLERHGLVDRISYREYPPRVEYSLTGKGRTVLPVLEAIAQTAPAWIDIADRPIGGRCRACDLMNRDRLPEQVRHDSRKTGRVRTDITLL